MFFFFLFLKNKNLLEWLLLPRELKQASRININSLKTKPNLAKKKVSSTTKKKKTTINIDLNTVKLFLFE